MLSDSAPDAPLSRKASLTMAVFRFWIWRIRPSMVSAICVQKLGSGNHEAKTRSYDEMLHIYRFLLSDSVDTVNGYK
jgi:hypothetical protein